MNYAQEKRQYGWYSQSQYDLGSGTNVYLTEDGREVFVTQVTDGPDHETQWTDCICLGIVTRWVRRIGGAFPQIDHGSRPPQRKL